MNDRRFERCTMADRDAAGGSAKPGRQPDPARGGVGTDILLGGFVGAIACTAIAIAVVLG